MAFLETVDAATAYKIGMLMNGGSGAAATAPLAAAIAAATATGPAPALIAPPPAEASAAAGSTSPDKASPAISAKPQGYVPGSLGIRKHEAPGKGIAAGRLQGGYGNGRPLSAFGGTKTPLKNGKPARSSADGAERAEKAPKKMDPIVFGTKGTVCLSDFH